MWLMFSQCDCAIKSAKKLLHLQNIYDGSMDIIEDFSRLLSRHFSFEQRTMIEDALSLACQRLEGMTRWDGQPFVNHAVGVAAIACSEIGLGRSSICAALLHDTVRLGVCTPEEIESRFTPKCAALVAGMCNISEVDTKMSETQSDNFKELILSYSSDPRVILIKLADRLEVMRSLDIFPEDKRRKKAWETLNIYAQIAHKLGLYTIKSEMEDLALKQLHPQEWTYITEYIKNTVDQREQFIAKFVEPIRQKMDAAGIKYSVKGRTKSVYSIWRKMKKYKIGIEEVFDLFAVRFVLKCAREDEKRLCWQTYSIVTDFNTPNPDRLRDWISIPKSNGYESLHTTVVTEQGRWVEVQIRSERMDDVAEHGVAAHWRYKGISGGAIGSEEWLATVRSMIENGIKELTTDETPDIKMTSKEIFVFTPNGDLRKLNENATVLDFAYDIHSALGNTCTGAKVNHRSVSIKHKLCNGDLVEIMTSKNQKPKADWLGIVTSSKAKSRIKAYLKEEQSKRAFIGREEIERKVKNWKLDLTFDEAIIILQKHFKIKNALDLYTKVADEEIETSTIKEILVESLEEQSEQPKNLVETTVKESQRVENDNEDCLVIDENLRGVEYKLGRCCNPIPGDSIFGFVTIAAGITIHRVDCPNATRLKTQYPYRVIDARWRNDNESGAFRAMLNIQARNSFGLVNKITEVLFKELRVNIGSINMTEQDGDTLSGQITVEVASAGMLDAVIYKLLKIKNIERVTRLK